jgi:hypothetical protein
MRMGGERKAYRVVLIPLRKLRQINDIAAEVTSWAHAHTMGSAE